MKEEKGHLIAKLKEVISTINGFSEKDLIGITKEQYTKQCENATK